MKATISAFILGSLLVLASCKDNPVSPISPAPTPAPTVSQLNATAAILFNQRIDIITALRSLLVQYAFGPDTMAMALYKAGYAIWDLASALKVVFKENPHACEQTLQYLNTPNSQDGLADLILRIYVDSLSAHREDLRSFLQELSTLDHSVRILDSLYSFKPQEVITFVYGYSPHIVAIVTSVHKYYPTFTEKDYLSTLWQLKCTALDAAESLGAISAKKAPEIGMLMKNAGYAIVDVVKAVCVVYNAGSLELASMLQQLGYQMTDALAILHSCGSNLADLAGLLKGYYNLDATHAAALLAQFATDLASLGSALESQYGLSDANLALIVLSLGHGIPETVKMFKDMGESPAQVIAVLKSISAGSEKDIAGILKDAGYQITDIVVALRSAYGSSYAQLAGILDQLSYSVSDVLATLKSAGCGFDELAGIVQAHYGKNPVEAAGYLRQLNADFQSIANALRNHYSLAITDDVLILKNLGAGIGDIVPILSGWLVSTQNIISDLENVGFSKCDILHFFNVPC